MMANDGNEHAISNGLVTYQYAERDPEENSSLLPYLANTVLSGASGMVGGALGSAAYWGVAGGALAFGGLGSVAVTGETIRCLSWQQSLLFGNDGASYSSLIFELSKQAMAVGISLGTVYGAVNGLVNAQYHEYFDTQIWEEPVVVGVCHTVEHDY